MKLSPALRQELERRVRTTKDVNERVRLCVILSRSEGMSLELKANLKQDEDIYFIDAVHPEFQSQAVCGWILKTETKTLPTTNKQFRLHLIGAINLAKMKVITREYETVNSENMIDYLKHLESNSSASKKQSAPRVFKNV